MGIPLVNDVFALPSLYPAAGLFIFLLRGFLF
ncbi:MAG: hypothetical protein ACI8T1_002661 [Verrucomicrobiales bacterium]|jgi:hypothetical protein